MKTPRGASLIELLAVMSACTMIFSLSGVLIHRTMRAQSQTRYFFENENSAFRLARQFRRDVHEAMAVELRDDAFEASAAAAFLRLELPGNDDARDEIEYRRQPTGIERVVVRGGAVASREQFPVSSISQLELRQQATPGRLVLRVSANPADLIPQNDKPAPTIRDIPVSFEIVGVMSRNVRVASTGADAKEPSP